MELLQYIISDSLSFVQEPNPFDDSNECKVSFDLVSFSLI